MAEFAGLFFLLLIVAMIATFPLWAIVLPQVMRDRKTVEGWRAWEKERRKAAVADMGRQMAALGLRPSDYTKEQLRQMQERA